MKDNAENSGAEPDDFVSPVFGIKDIVDLPSLATKLRQPPDPVSAYLKCHLSRKARATLRRNSRTLTENQLASLIVPDLNEIICGQSIYDRVRFQHVELNDRLKSLLPLRNKDRYRQLVNRLLLEAAYPTELRTMTFWSEPILEAFKRYGLRFWCRIAECFGVRPEDSDFCAIGGVIKASWTFCPMPGQYGGPEYWIRSKIRGEAKAFVRIYARHVEVEEAHLHQEHKDSAPASWRRRPSDLLRAIERLSPTQREIIRYIYDLDMSSVEVGPLVKLTPEGVRIAHKRALEKLKKFLEKLPDDLPDDEDMGQQPWNPT